MLNSHRRSWQMARCLVTGASSGLGEALAEQLVKAGARVVLTGRSAERLQAIADRLIDEGSDTVANHDRCRRSDRRGRLSAAL